MDINITKLTNTDTLVSFLRKDIGEQLNLKVFQRNLNRFEKDWIKTGSQVYAKSQKDLKQTVSLKFFGDKASLSSSGSVKLAEITLDVRSNKLTSFAHSTNNESVANVGTTASTHRVTRVAILRSKGKQVAIIGKKSKSSFFAGARDQKTPVHKGKIKGFSPKGYKNKIFIRLQANTWRQGRRLPIAEMYGIPNAYLLNSKRTKAAFNFEQRLKELWKP